MIPCLRTWALCLALPVAATSVDPLPRSLVAVVPEDFPPTYFRDPATGKPAGYSVDVLEAIAAREGLTVTFTFGAGWDEIHRMVQDGRADLIPNLVVNPERAQAFAFTRPVETTPICFFARSASEPRPKPGPGVRIGSIQGSTGAVWLRDHSEVEGVTYGHLQALLMDLLTGRLDLALTAAPNLEKLALDAGVAGQIVRLGPPVQEGIRAMALRKDDVELLARLNRGIEAYIGTREHQAVYRKWWGAPRSPWTPRRILTWSGAVGGFLLLAMALWRHHSVSRLARDLGREVQERRRSEDALRASEARFRTVFEAAQDGIVIFNEQGKVLDVNPAFAAMRGLSRGECLDRVIFSFDLPDTAALGPERLERMLGGEAIRVDLLQRRADGSTFTVEATGVRVDLESGPAILSLHRDLTERHALQAQLFQAQRMESLGRLAGGVAHDMNNVLAAILSLASAQAPAHPPEGGAGQAFRVIIQAAERGGAMVRSLLGFARRTATEARTVDLNELLREEVRLLERTTLSRVHLVLDLAPDLPAMLGDPAALSHALMNLCVNAVDAMPGNGTLTLRTRALTEGRVEVQVQDTGIGMAPEVLAQAMDPFFTTKEPGKGTGLGLAQVFGTVQAHNGTLALESTPGQGTTVRLTFPAAPAAAPAALSEEPALAAPATRRLVLVVDDDDLIRQATSMLLEALGHRAEALDSGEAALARLAAEPRPDVVILDMNMPGLGGAGTLPRLRALCPALPVFLATGQADDEAMRLTATDPLTQLLPKPYALVDLQGRLQGLAAAPLQA